jgi:hypothetical protein
MNYSLRSFGLLAILSLAACSTEHEFRVASVGDGSRTAATEAASAVPSAPLIVAAGNVLLGSSARITPPAADLPTGGVVNGTVSAILLTSGQSVVQLTDGTALLINSASSTLGQVVSIDLGKGQVIGGPSSLVGVSVLPSGGAAGAQLASVSAGGTSIGVGTNLIGRPVAGVPALPTGNAGQSLGPVSATATVVQPVTSTVTNTVGGTLGHLCC